MKTPPAGLKLPTSRRFLAKLVARRQRRLAASAAAVLLTGSLSVATTVRATDYTWNGGGVDDLWGTGANWVGGNAPTPSSTNNLHFAGSTRLTPNNNYAAFEDFQDILFDAGASSFTISGNSLDLFGKIENNSANLQTFAIASFSMNSATRSELDATAGDLTIALTGASTTGGTTTGLGGNLYNNGNTINVYGNNNKTLTLATGTVMTGTGGFFIHDNTNVVINSAQTYTGTTAIDAGKLTTAATLGNNTGAIFLGNGGTGTINGISGQPLYANTNATFALSASGLTLANAITTNKADTGAALGTGTRIIQTTYGSGTSTLSGSLTLNGGVVFDTATGGTLAVAGVVANGTDTGNVSRSLTKTGAGTLTLSGTNTYTGGTKINAGTLSISNDNNLGSTTVANGVSLNGGTLDTGANAVTLNANHGITVGVNGGTLTTSRTSSNLSIQFSSTNTLSGAGALLFQGTGTATGSNSGYTINAAQNISGPITITNTRLVLSNAAATVGTSDITVSSTGELFIGTTPTTTLSNNLFLSGNNTDGSGAIRNSGTGNTTFGGNITLQANAGIGGGTATTVTTLNGNISGAFTLQLGGLTNSNAGATYILNGLATSTGVTISSGTLRLGTANAAAGTVLTNSATLAFASGIGTFNVGALAGASTIALTDTAAANVTLQVGSSTVGNATYSGILTGGGAFIKTGTNTETLSGASTFTGNVTINNGVLVSNGAGVAATSGPLGIGTTTVNTNGELRATATSALLGSAGITLAGGTLRGSNAATTTYGGNVTVTTNSTVINERSGSASSISMTDTFGTLSIGANTLNVTSTNNQTGGTAGVTFGATTLTGASTFNITNNSNATDTTLLTLGAVTNGANTATFTGSGNFAQAGVWGGGAGGINFGVSGGATYTGTATFNQANTYTGANAINSGTVVIGVSNATTVSGALGTSAATVTLGAASGSANASLLANGFTFSNNITVAAGSSGNTLTLGGNSGTNSTFSGTLSLNNNLTVSQVASGTTTFSGLASINASNLTLTQSGAGGINLSGGLSFNGASGTTFATAGTAAAGTNTGTTVGAITFASGANAMALSGSAFTLSGNLTNSSGAVQTIGQNITLSNAAHTINNGVTLNGNITTGTGINGNVTFAGAGTSILAGTNSFISTNANGVLAVNTGATLNLTGATTVSGTGASGGQLFVGSNTASTNTVTVATGGLLTISGTTNATTGASIIGQQSIGILNVNGTLTHSATGFYVGNTTANQGAGSQLNVGVGGLATFATGAAGTDGAYLLLGRSGGTGTINLNSGTLETGRTIARNGGGSTDIGTANFNFNGGTLRALANNNDWLASATTANAIGTSSTYALTAVTTGATSGNISTIDSNGFAVAINNNISGNGGFIIANTGNASTGAVTLGGASTYSGGTTVNAGTLLVSNTVSGTNSGTGTGAVTVNNTGTLLGGTGSIAGAVAVNGGAAITGGTAGSGNAIVAGNVGPLTLQSGLAFSGATGSLASFLVDLSGATSDRLTITGLLNLSGTFDRIAFNGTADGTSSYVLASYAGGVMGTFDTVSNLPAGYGLVYNAGELDLVPVPEPGTVAAGLLALGTLGLSQRRRVRRFLTMARRQPVAKAA